MAYIGRGTENISNVEVLDNLTFDGSASYTLQKSSTNFVPSSANNLLISISGVVQQGNFSVSGSTITFDTTVSASDTCDWILHYGTGLITTVADGTITEAKLGSSAVTTAKINNGAITSAKLDSGLALGKIGQVVSTAASSRTTTTSSSEVVAATSNSITPSSTSSKILVLVHGFVGNLRTGDQLPTFTKIYRDIGGTETQISSSKTAYSDTENVSTHFKYNTSGLTNHMLTNVAYTILDEPSTTSAVTYKWKHRNYGGGTDIVGGVVFNLMEVLA